ncbi:hypothetical protein ACFY2Q_26680 [Micromonospora sp. NPDC000316]|uniref:hypothetical protein n=1 Tax=Micromonospora sp. NPDC000316 TaxID=3364216 RepID=UPI0036933F56
MRVAGRPLPNPHDRPPTRQRPACRQCVARDSATTRAYVWATHEDLACLRHQRWFGTIYQNEQLDLGPHPDILRANRRHRRLIAAYGGEQVRSAFTDATTIWHHWRQHQWSDSPFHQRLRIFEKQGYSTLTWTDTAIDAATYPETVALTRLLASPYWRHQALSDNLAPQPSSADDAWDTIQAEIRAGQRHPDDMPDDLRLAAAGLLRQGPALTRFINEIQRTVNVNYRWSPWAHYRRFPPLTEWIMDQISAIQSSHHFRPRPPSPERFGSQLSGYSLEYPIRYG